MRATRASIRSTSAAGLSLLLQDRFYRGANAHPRNYSTALQTSMIASMVANGVKTVRVDIDWGQYETPSKGTYSATQQGHLDTFIAAAAVAGLDVLAVVTGSPSWSNGAQAENVPPTSNTDYADFVAYVMGRYPSIRYIEVWNEPNLTNSWTPTSAANYKALLAVAYARIKSVDANVKVLGPSLSNYDAGAFLTAFYAAGGGAFCDILSIHTYGDPPGHGNLTPEALLTTWVTNIWPIIAGNGDAAKPIWLTEIGYNSGTGGVTDTVLADYVGRLYRAVRQQVPTCARLYWYEYLNDADDGASGNSYGIIRQDGGSKLATAAYAAIPG